MKKRNEEGAVPCYCGSYPSVQKYGDYRHHNDGEWDIECQGCGMEFRMFHTKEGAISGWNSTMEDVYTIEPEIMDAIRQLVNHAKGQREPGLGLLELIVARNRVEKFLKGNSEHDE